FSFLLLILWIVVIAWVYRDAEKRGMNGVLWALLVFIGNIIGLLIFLIVRSDNRAAPPRTVETYICSNCKKFIQPQFKFCPSCGETLDDVCPKCKKPIKTDWKVCPDCGEKLSD
ncbi:MAG: zinc ribbon domain-containing protein, partial [Acidobacteria bacterium]|nr:zinc ribbon domain-containing protein [Acidobacteriota bacterium]